MTKDRLHFFKPKDITGLELLTCSDIDYRFPPHFHSEYCIWFNTRCAEQYTCGGSSSILGPGEFGIIAPGEVHANHPYEAQSRHLITFYLAPEKLQQIAAQIQDRSSANAAIQTRYCRDPEMFGRLLSLQGSLTCSASAMERETAVLDVTATLLSRYGTPLSPKHPATAEPARVAEIIDLFHARIGDDISLDEIAAHFGCTPYHLIRFFKKSIGIPPHAYLLQLRLEKAKELLGKGRPIADAAQEAGFSDQSHLTRQFKKKFGITPGRYCGQVIRG